MIYPSRLPSLTCPTRSLMRRALAYGLLALLAGGISPDASARDFLHVTGSSTVAPFNRAVLERLAARMTKPAWIEETGTGGGLHLFCAGVGDNTPDIAGASRRISAAEFALCQKNGVTPIELRIGFDGIVVAHTKSNPAFGLTREQLYLAMVAVVPNREGQLIANPYKHWSDISQGLPARRIEIIGPPRTSGTRDAIHALIMEEGCRQYQQRHNLQINGTSCRQVRIDGAYVEAGENDALIVTKLGANANAVGLFGFSHLLANADKLQAVSIEGNLPISESIFDGRYPLNRHIYVYAKKENVPLTPYIQDFINEFTSDQTFGPEGYLARKGLVPLPKSERDTVGRSARALIGLAGL